MVYKTSTISFSSHCLLAKVQLQELGAEERHESTKIGTWIHPTTPCSFEKSDGKTGEEV
jgi:hypothetical protein